MHVFVGFEINAEQKGNAEKNYINLGKVLFAMSDDCYYMYTQTMSFNESKTMAEALKRKMSR